MSKQLVISSKHAALLLAALVLFGLYLTNLYSYLLFHSLVELFSIVVACGIFMIAWNSRRFLDNNYLLFIGIAYLFIGGLDLIHTLAYTGMGVFQGYGTNLPAQLWISARYVESLSLLIAFLFLGRRLRPNLVLLSYAAATSLLLMSIFYWNIFPQSFVEGVGLTSFKKVSEYIISLILLGSMAMLVKNRRGFDRGVLQLLGVSIAFTIASELAFTFYVQAYDLSNMIGHFFKVISFYLIYKAVIETGLRSPYDLLFRNLKQSEEGLQKAHDELEGRVEQRTAELATSNEELQIEMAERQRSEEERALLQRRIEALWGIASMVDADFKTLYDRVVAETLAMTQSYYARYGFISEDESMFTLYAWSEQAQQDCQVRGRPLHRPVDKGGLWADAVRQRKALIINDYQADHPGKKGLPGGHVQLTRVLTVPIFSHGRIVALATVANKPSDYTEEDARQIEAFATGAQVILERKQAEEQLREVSRALRTISLCNQALVRATEEPALLQGICRTIVENGGYRLAWVGFAEQDEKKTVRPVAQAGYEEGYLDTVNLTWADIEGFSSLTGRAISTGRPVIRQNFLTDLNHLPWRDEALKRGYASSITLPLLAGEQAFGALNIYAAEPDAFDVEEVGLLTELADDLAYGIMTLRIRDERQRAEHNLGERVKELACLHGVSRLVAKTGAGLDDVLRGAVSLIPPGWQYPEVTCARIAFHGREFRTDNFASTKWKQSSDIKAGGEKVGSIEVYYMEKKPELDEGPFLKEERNLIDGLARLLGEMAEHQKADEERSQRTKELETALEQLRATQAQLIQADRLATIGQLVSGVAHEVNNPLTAVIGYAQLLLQRDLDEDIKSDLEVVWQEAQRAAAICKNLLSFARQQKPERANTFVNDAVEGTLALRAYQMRLSNIEVVTELQPDLPGTMADGQQLRQVFLNMVINAEQAMTAAHGGGRLVVKTQEVGHSIQIVFADDGPGIPKKHLSRVFDPFFTTKEVGKGTGLGLSICYGIVQEHGGNIRVESKVGEGATFTVEVPMVSEDAGPAKEG